MSNSAFNMSKCGSSGGSGGGGCNATGWTQVTSTNGDDITVISTDIIRHELRKIYENDPQNHTTQIADIVYLKYDCPRVGDAVFWNSYKDGYDLASAEIDNGNYTKDPEHLIESLAIVEKVEVNCETGRELPEEGFRAKVVFFGKITFGEETTDLEPGVVYYLSDTLARINASTQLGSMIGSNAVHARLEPVISKPLFVATGKHTAIVTNYRPLTGSPTGGRPLSEEYKLTIKPNVYNDADGNFLYTGWKIKVENTGTVTSRNNLLLQIEYNKLEGPQPKDQDLPLINDEIYVHHANIGVLYNAAEANIKDDDVFVSYKEIDFTPETESYVTGIGEIDVKLKVLTQSTSNITFTDKLSSPEVLVTNASQVSKSKIVPTLTFEGDCENNTDNDNDVYIKGSTVVQPLDSEEGTVFAIKLQESILSHSGTTNPPETKKIPMPYNIGFKIDSVTELPDGRYQENVEFSPITGTFKLQLPDREMLEVIPITASGQTVVENNLRITATDRTGKELPETHWAYIYSKSVLKNNLAFCFSGSCCIDSLDQLRPDSLGELSREVEISDILTNGDSLLLNNKDNAKLYSKSINSPSHTSSRGTLAISWKNCRENTLFCYPPTDAGTEPAFMTIYANEARDIDNLANHKKTENEAQFYDPRYVLMEIGAQETLNGKLVRLTVNSGSTSSSTPETCFSFIFDGSIRGGHFTLEELEHIQGPTKFQKREIR